MAIEKTDGLCGREMNRGRCANMWVSPQIFPATCRLNPRLRCDLNERTFGKLAPSLGEELYLIKDGHKAMDF